MSTESNYYVPEESRLPVLGALALGLMALGAGLLLNDGTSGILWVGTALLVSVMYIWFRTVIRENIAGMNSDQLKRSYVWGMSWFIFSEVMFFAVFFGTLFYVRTLALPWLGGEGDRSDMIHLVWPEFTAQWPLMETPSQAAGSNEFIGPEHHMSFPGWDKMFHWLPLWNTIILLTSSVTVHFAHHAIKHDDRKKFNIWLAVSVLLGIIFLFLQYEEYHEAYTEMGLTLESGIYGSTFFMLTGFHGFHVTMGTFMLLIQLIRGLKGHFSADDQFGFEASSWYWHFVDVVWAGLFLFVYVLA
ncbi:MAG: cytochrome c oxidase subunit 3 [Porticoccaceae bacterium]|nr:cytochrome c oxidase subunit 3 [Porticoccaceae bacterium]